MTDLRHRVSKDLIADFSNGSLGKSSWVTQFRDDSKNRFVEMGAPIQSDEEWRLSDPKLFTKTNYEKNNDTLEKIYSPFDQLDRIILVFIDGVFSGIEGELGQRVRVWQVSISYRRVLDFVIPWLDPLK